MNLPTIVLIVVFVVWVEENIFVIVTIVECASIHYCLMITTAKLGSTCRIVQCVRKIYLAVEKLPMKCKYYSSCCCFLFLLIFSVRPCESDHAFQNHDVPYLQLRPCGHAIHWHCFKELTTYDTRCPVCKKTAESPEHMAPTWQAMAMGIALQPVPPELARVVTIMCNDCEELDENRRWHFLGVRCQHCMSFNTTVERTSLTGREAAVYLDELDRNEGIHNEVRQMDAS
jgi:Zinc-ribbon